MSLSRAIGTVLLVIGLAWLLLGGGMGLFGTVFGGIIGLVGGMIGTVFGVVFGTLGAVFGIGLGLIGAAMPLIIIVLLVAGAVKIVSTR